MKLPRDVSGHELARALSRFGYAVTRQTGSHMRLTSLGKGSEHHVTIPNHDPLRVGTISQILSDVSSLLADGSRLTSQGSLWLAQWCGGVAPGTQSWGS